jgi:hypothetical protein
VSSATWSTRWPEDPGHRDAIDTLLVMAAAEDRWGESRRAMRLLDQVECLAGALPRPYERIRWRCRCDSRGAPMA